MDASQSNTSGAPPKDRADAGVRWHKIAIDQLGYALNLILTFAIAALGYCFVLLRDSGFIPGCFAKYTLLISLVSLVVSAASGLACVLVRLQDFRATAKRASNHPMAPSREDVRILDERTWWFFRVHLYTFAIGVAALAVTLLLTYGRKLV